MTLCIFPWSHCRCLGDHSRCNCTQASSLKELTVFWLPTQSFSFDFSGCCHGIWTHDEVACYLRCNEFSWRQTFKVFKLSIIRKITASAGILSVIRIVQLHSHYLNLKRAKRRQLPDLKRRITRSKSFCSSLDDQGSLHPCPWGSPFPLPPSPTFQALVCVILGKTSPRQDLHMCYLASFSNYLQTSAWYSQ